MTRTALLLACGLVTQLAAQNIVTGEYWIDSDPGFGQATPITGQPTGADVDYAFNIPTTTLSPGMHTIIYRTKQANGTWSHTNHRPLYVAAAPPANSNIVRTVYFLNSDPGWGGGTDANVDGAPEVADANTTVDLASANVGMNTLFYRSQDASGRWSHTNHRPLYVADSSSGAIVRVEYFWDTDPGFGLSPLDTVLANPAADWSGTLVATVPLGIGLADHLLFVRSRDSRGRWGLTNICDTVDVTGSTDVDELADKTGITVYPNPFAETITVQPSETKPLRVILYDPQ
ncbi:MAG: hypothetical protein KA352_14855, partial [Flavobacteriales bacterium]|nr:hypothetical protein [Flavobacteriales bacterium]